MYRSDEYPILPVGRTNMLTAKNAEWGSIFNLWAEDDGTYILFRATNWDRKTNGDKVSYRAVITSGELEDAKEWLPVGTKVGLVHDQTGARFGWNAWTVVGHFANSRAGLRQMAEACETKSIPFATFK